MNLLMLIRRSHASQYAVVIVAAGIALWWAWSAVAVMQQNYLYERKLAELKQHQRLAELQTATLAYEQRYLRSDEYVELRARDVLGKAALGETLVILPPYNQVSSGVTPTAPVKPLELSNPEKWWHFFFG
jgi:cell division protein FtsB